MHSLKHVINILILSALIILISSCGLLEPPDKNGELIIVLKKQESLGKVSIVQSDTLASVQCILKKGSTTVYDQNLTKNGSYYEGEIKNLEPADNYSVLLYGKNSSQNIIRRGYESRYIRLDPDRSGRRARCCRCAPADIQRPSVR